MKNKVAKPYFLRKIGTPRVLIPGLVLAATLGWVGWKELGPDFYKNKLVFPESEVVRQIEDGDTFELQNGTRVRMLGVDAPTRDTKSTDGLAMMIKNKRVWLEYDRYQDDKYGRILAWVWIECEGKPKFLPFDYMHKSKRESNLGLTENPIGCSKGKLVQEEMVKKGLAEVEVYKDRGELKYEKRLFILTSQLQLGILNDDE